MSFGYDPRRAAELPDDSLPDGEYDVLIDSCEDKETRSGTGNYLEFTLVVTSGRYRNFQIRDRVNYRNQNPKAEEIGYRTLKKITKAVFGRDDVQWSAQSIVGKKMKIKTKSEEQDNGYTAINVKSYAPVAVPDMIQMDRKPVQQTQQDDDDVPF